MLYVSNAFSLNMLKFGKEYRIQLTPIHNPKTFVKEKEMISAVGHSDTAKIFAEILDRPVVANRVSVQLTPADVLLVGQYRGPRLPEGSTTLPEGATIEWTLVELESMWL
jgi:hypothetical protein